MSHPAVLHSSSYSLSSCNPCSRGDYHHSELAPLVLDPPPPGVLQDVCLAGDVLVTALKTGVWFYGKVDHADSEEAAGVRWVLKDKREESSFISAYRCQSVDPFFVSRGSGDASRFFRYVCVASGSSSLGHSISVTSTASKFVHHHELHGTHRILAFALAPITASGSFIFHQSPLAVSIDARGGIAVFDIERNAAQWLLVSACASAEKERSRELEKSQAAGTEEDKRIPYCCRSDRVPVKLVLHGPCTDAFCPWCRGQEKGPAATRRRGIPLTVHIVVVRNGRGARFRCPTTKKEHPYSHHHHHHHNHNSNNALCQQQTTKSSGEIPIDDPTPLTSSSAKKRIEERLGGDSQQEILQLHILWSTNQAIVVDETVIHSESIRKESEVKNNSSDLKNTSKKSFTPSGGDLPARVGWGKRLRIHPFCVSLVAAEEGRFILQVSSEKMLDCLVFLHGCTGDRCGVSPSLLSMDLHTSASHTLYLEKGRGEQEEGKDSENKPEGNPRFQRDDQHVYIRHWIPVGFLQDKGTSVPSSSTLDISVAVTSSGRVLLFGAEKSVREGRSAYEQFIEAEKKTISDWLKEEDDDAVEDELERGKPEQEEILMGSHSPLFMRLANQKEHQRRTSVRSDTLPVAVRTCPEYVLIREVVDVRSWFCSYPSMYMCLLGREDMDVKEMILTVLPRITVDTVRKKVHLHMLGGDHYVASLFERVEKKDNSGNRAHSLRQLHLPFWSMETSYYPNSNSTELATFASLRGRDPPRRGDTAHGALNDPSVFSWGIARTLGSTLLNSLHSSKLLLADTNRGTSLTPFRGDTRTEVARERSLTGTGKGESLSSRSPSSFPLNERLFCFDSLGGKGLGNPSTRASFPSHIFVDISHPSVRSRKKIDQRRQEHVLKTIYLRIQGEEEKMNRKKGDEIKAVHAHPLHQLASHDGFLPYPTPQASLGSPFYPSLPPYKSKLWHLQNVEEPREREQIEWNDEVKRDQFWTILRKIQKYFFPSLLTPFEKMDQQENPEPSGIKGNASTFSRKGRRGSPFTGEPDLSVSWGSLKDLFVTCGGGGFTSPFFQAAFNAERVAWEGPDRHQMRTQLHDEYLYLQSTMSLPLAHRTLEDSPPIPSHILALQERDRLTFEVQDLILRHREELATFQDPMEKITLFEIQEKKIVSDGEKGGEGDRLHAWRRHGRTPFVYPQGRPASLEQWQKHADERSSLLVLGGVGVGGGGRSGWVWAQPDKADKDGEHPENSAKMERGKRITIVSDLLGWCLGPWRYMSSITDGLPNLMSEEFWSAQEKEDSILRCREIHRTRVHLHNLWKINEKKKSQEEELRALRAGLSLH